MEPMHYLALSAGKNTDFVRSALPDAPVVAFVARPEPTRGMRRAIAGTLYRLGDAIAPATQQTESATA